MIKVVMPNSGFKVKPPSLPGFLKMFTYDSLNYTYLNYYPLYFTPPAVPKLVLAPDTLTHTLSIDLTRCDIIYDKHLDKIFRVFVYYSSLYGQDGLIEGDTFIHKD
jgi:hypothetical protein